MLTKTQQQIASKVANDLIVKGLLVGEELEWFVRGACVGRCAFKTQEHYQEFEDHVLDLVEERRKIIKISDIKSNKEIKVKTIGEVVEVLKVSRCRVYDALRKDLTLKNRYKLKYVRASILDLIEL